MPSQYNFEYHFFPVGQGLFAIGFIRRNDDRAIRYTWVYDCGTLSRDELLGKAIDVFEGSVAARKRIDLVTLSHFDKDHISGVCRLIERFRIGTLMLPYMGLAERLVLAFEEGIDARDALSGFFLNPVAFLLSQGGPGIERILFVPASGAEGPPVPDGSPRVPDLDGDGPRIDFYPDKPSDSDEWLPLVEAGVANGMQTQVELLRRGEAIRVSSFWEFLPYNDDPEDEIPMAFRLRVSEERDRLLDAKNRRSRNNGLRRLKKIYDGQFGASSVERNVISLSLYSGPIYASWRACQLLDVWEGPVAQRLEPRRRMWVFPRILSLRTPRACSMIYTGDCYLETAERLQRFVRFFRPERIEMTGIFQVMHHGAEGNWHKGVAASIRPIASVFSSDPERRQWAHPDAAVLRDFWPYGPCQADNNQAVGAGGTLISN